MQYDRKAICHPASIIVGAWCQAMKTPGNWMLNNKTEGVLPYSTAHSKLHRAM